MSSDPIPGDQAGDDRVAQPPSTVHWRELKVLLVDDHPAYCLLMGAMFERLGLAFEVCAHGQAALAFLDVTCVDLIFSDCQMPVMDGFAMTRELRRREQRAGTQGVPVIAFTGKLGAHEIQQCQAAGMDAWLDKPVTFQQLRQVLGDWLPGPRISEAVQPMVAVEGRWPSRARLGQLFGCPEALPGGVARHPGEPGVRSRDRSACAGTSHRRPARAGNGRAPAPLDRQRGILRCHTAGKARSPVDRSDQPRRRGHAPSALARIAQRLDRVFELFVGVRKWMTVHADVCCRSSERGISFFSVGQNPVSRDCWAICHYCFQGRLLLIRSGSILRGFKLPSWWCSCFA